ncbi:MAG: SH3 domain-containing protein [Pseudomonadota bacterium]
MPAALTLLACYGAALLLTLALAAWLTPRAWWRRANARALAVLVAGTGAFGTALWWWAAPDAPPPPAPLAVRLDAPLPGRSYRVADALNLRAAVGVGSARVAVLPAGAVVTATGRQDGDWWRVRAEVEGVAVEGWASSLWLRRADERRR